MEDELLETNQSSVLLLLQVDQKRFPSASGAGVSLVFFLPLLLPLSLLHSASLIIATWKMIGAAEGQITKMVQLTLTKHFFYFLSLR